MLSPFILLTAEDHISAEIELLISFFNSGLQCLHLRKPSWSIDQVSIFLNKIPSRYHNRIVLHDHHALHEKYRIRGLHFNNRFPITDEYLKLSLSKSSSLHSLEELQTIPSEIDYVFLSPIFKSISKQNYPAAFDKKELTLALKNCQTPIFALGGLSPKTIPLAFEMGFKGVVVLGAVWKAR